MRMFQKCIVLMGTLGVTACGAVFNSSIQKVEFQTPGVTEVTCIVKNDDYLYDVIAPHTVLIERTHKNLYMTCSKNGYQTVERVLKPRANPSTYWNVLNGVIPGTAYDIGARTAFAYPKVVVVDMQPLSEGVDHALGNTVIFDPVVNSATEPAPATQSDADHQTPVVVQDSDLEPEVLFDTDDTLLRDDLTASGLADGVVEDSLSGRK